MIDLSKIFNYTSDGKKSCAKVSQKSRLKVSRKSGISSSLYLHNSLYFSGCPLWLSFGTIMSDTNKNKVSKLEQKFIKSYLAMAYLWFFFQ